MFPAARNRPDSVLEVTAWAQEHFQESSSHRCRLKLRQAEKKPHVNPETLPSPLDQSSFRWTEAERKLFCGQMDQNLMLQPPD